MSNRILSFEDFTKKRQLKPGKVKTPEIEVGSFAFIARLNSDDRDLLETQWIDYKGGEENDVGFRAFSVAWCLCDENNERLFDTGKEDQVPDEFLDCVAAFGKTNGAVMSRLFDEAAKLNGLTKQDIDELEKNLEATELDAGNSAKQQQAEKALANGSVD